MSLREAVEQAVTTHPAVGAARANRAAAGYELRQAQGRFLPRVDLSADIGSQKVDQPAGLSPSINNQWRDRRQATIDVKQVIFAGGDRKNDVYRAAARLDAASLRVLDRTQLLALDAVEAYIDVRRSRDLVALARENLDRHREILRLVAGRVEGGRAPKSEIEQTRERVAAAEAVLSQLNQSYLEAAAKFQQVIGIQPPATEPVPYPRGFRMKREDAIQIGVANNPSVLALEADAEAARYEFRQSHSSSVPEIALEGIGRWGENLDGTPGQNDDLQGKIVLTWTLFNGLINSNRRRELAERWTAAQLERDVKAREIIEQIDRALAAVTVGQTRVRNLEEQVDANEKVVKTYREEYELSKRSLLDMLDAHSAYFNSRFQLISVRAVHKFSAYQLLATTGQLLTALDVAPPPEVVADHLVQSQGRLGVFNIDIEPLRRW